MGSSQNVAPDGSVLTTRADGTPGGLYPMSNRFDYDFAEIAIKGRSSQGNTVTKYPVKKITQLEAGTSSLGAQKIYFDTVSGRLNKDNRGTYLGEFDSGEMLILIYSNGDYLVRDTNLDIKLNIENMMFIGKLNLEKPFNAIYYDGEKKRTMVKGFIIETSKGDSMYNFIPGSRSS